MAITAGTKIIEDGLILNIDPANEKAVQTGSLEVEYLIVAGGGGGAVHNTGGAGGGGVVSGYASVSGTNAIVIGAGGTNGNLNTLPTVGSNSTGFGKTALGGGTSGQWVSFNGNSGGSGGGGNAFSDSSQPVYTNGKSATQPGSASGGFGNSGGNGFTSGSDRAGGGGGGAGSPGKDALSGRGGNGGDGFYSLLTNQHYAGGGGGAHRTNSNISSGGKGGGGRGLSVSAAKDGTQNGTSNTGGGAGGIESGSQTGAGGGNGGSGVVLVRYKGPRRANGGDNVYEENGYTVHVFNNSGNFVVGGAVGDVSGNSNGGAVNGASYNAGNQGYYSFDGTDDYIQTNYVLNPGSSFSCECWFKLDLIKEWHNLCCAYINGTDRNFQMFVGGTGGFQVFWKSSNPPGGQISGTLANTVYYGAFTYNSANTTGTLYRYGNNTFNSSTVSQPASGTFGNQTFRIGARTDGSANGFVNGNIYMIRIYNRALTATEINRNFQATRGRFGI